MYRGHANSYVVMSVQTRRVAGGLDFVLEKKQLTQQPAILHECAVWEFAFMSFAEKENWAKSMML